MRNSRERRHDRNTRQLVDRAAESLARSTDCSLREAADKLRVTAVEEDITLRQVAVIVLAGATAELDATGS